VEAVLDVLASPRRREILRLVWEDERSSREIARHFDVTWQAVSQNLRVLRDAGLIVERRHGRQRFYRADRETLRPLEAFLTQLWGSSLDRLATLAEREHRRR
jgi:DNA-binding transcriptional ArsR family regulator